MLYIWNLFLQSCKCFKIYERHWVCQESRVTASDVGSDASSTCRGSYHGPYTFPGLFCSASNNAMKSKASHLFSRLSKLHFQEVRWFFQSHTCELDPSFLTQKTIMPFNLSDLRWITTFIYFSNTLWCLSCAENDSKCFTNNNFLIHHVWGSCY